MIKRVLNFRTLTLLLLVGFAAAIAIRLSYRSAPDALLAIPKECVVDTLLLSELDAKVEQIDNFISALNTHIDNRAQDQIPTKGYDSFVGVASFHSEERLQKALYALFDIPLE